MSFGQHDHFDQYLGDGVYARFDGYHIWLSTERDGGTHEVALEPEVFANLTQYEARLREMLAARKRGGAS